MSSLYKDFNYGRQEMEQIMPYCRISVEKYVFEKTHATLFGIYQAKNQAEDAIFQEKLKAIFSTLTPERIFEDISLSQDLHFCPTEHPAYSEPGGLLKTVAIR